MTEATLCEANDTWRKKKRQSQPALCRLFSRELRRCLRVYGSSASASSDAMGTSVPNRPSFSSLRPAVKNNVVVGPAPPPLPTPRAHNPSMARHEVETRVVHFDPAAVEVGNKQETLAVLFANRGALIDGILLRVVHDQHGIRVHCGVPAGDGAVFGDKDEAGRRGRRQEKVRGAAV